MSVIPQAYVHVEIGGEVFRMPVFDIELSLYRTGIMSKEEIICLIREVGIPIKNIAHATLTVIPHEQ